MGKPPPLRSVRDPRWVPALRFASPVDPFPRREFPSASVASDFGVLRTKRRGILLTAQELGGRLGALDLKRQRMCGFLSSSMSYQERRKPRLKTGIRTLGPLRYNSPIPSTPPITELLMAWGDGDQAALDQLIPIVHAELRRLAHRAMRGERPGHTLQATGLVNEAFMRLVELKRIRWQNRVHFFAISARLMRRILVDVARSKRSHKRGDGVENVSLDEALTVTQERGADLVALDDALKALAVVDSRKSEVVELKFFGGLSVQETAEALQVSPETVMRDWQFAKVWLLRELTREGHRDA
jgi:RNA polymerase sigma-70 factor, ECF subfamily